METTEAVEKQSQAYEDMKDVASLAMLEIASRIDDILVAIVLEKAKRSQAEERILRAEYVVEIAQIHAPADVLKAEKGRVEPSDEQWRKLRFCESTEQYDISTGNGYYGAYQFDLITWVGVGGEGDLRKLHRRAGREGKVSVSSKRVVSVAGVWSVSTSMIHAG